MTTIEIIKTIGITVASGTITASLIFAGNKFYKGVVLLIDLNQKYTEQEKEIKSLVKATTEDIPNQISALNNDVIDTHKEYLNTFTEELLPIKNDVKEIKIDILNLKKHTNFPENGY